MLLSERCWKKTITGLCGLLTKSLCAPPCSILVYYKRFTCSWIQIALQPLQQIHCVSALSRPFVCWSFFNPLPNNQIKGERNVLAPSALSRTEKHISALWFPCFIPQEMCVVVSSRRNGTGVGETSLPSHQPLHPAVWLTAVSLFGSVLVSGLRDGMSGHRLRAQVRLCRMRQFYGECKDAEMIKAQQMSLRVGKMNNGWQGQSHKDVCTCMSVGLPKKGPWQFCKSDILKQRRFLHKMFAFHTKVQE